MYSESELAIIQDALSETRHQDPVRQRFDATGFVSTSKGRGRKRKRLKEVGLICDTWDDISRWYTRETFPYDTKATETLPHLSGHEAETTLVNAIEQIMIEKQERN